MFSTIFKCLNQAVLMADMGLQLQTREPIKSIRTASNFTKWPWLEMTKEDTVHIKNMQSNKMNIIQHTAWAFNRKYSDVTPFVIIDIFRSNCNLIIHFFSVTDYSHIYFVIKLCNFQHCALYHLERGNAVRGSKCLLIFKKWNETGAIFWGWNLLN